MSEIDNGILNPLQVMSQSYFKNYKPIKYIKIEIEHEALLLKIRKNKH